MQSTIGEDCEVCSPQAIVVRLALQQVFFNLFSTLIRFVFVRNPASS